ncbi:MAG: ASCH domain-containing protein [Enterobacteriaceae bacterium]|jgi:predicted transcriptional regulator|nr:ASCH domain-containing protein [Enterobacteriaceae bacterium]
MKVLLSIKPEFAEKILNGTKKYEFRKGIFKNTSVRSVVIYATMPIGRIVGEFDIENIIEDEPEVVWHKTYEHAGISKQFFDSYFDKKKKAFAIKIGNVKKYSTPISLNEMGNNIVAPQSYRYLPAQ